MQEDRVVLHVKVEGANSRGLVVEYRYGSSIGRGILPKSQFGPVSGASAVTRAGYLWGADFLRSPLLFQDINYETRDSLIGSELRARLLDVDEVGVKQEQEHHLI
jgi:hypothetical protein